MTPLNRNIENELTDCNKQLHHLMLITEAINENASIESLFEIYQHAVSEQYRTQMISLCISRGNKVQVFSNKPSAEEENFLIAYLQFTKKRKRKVIRTEKELYIPVYHKEELIALAHLTDLSLQGSEDFKFLKTITNFVAIAIENKRLFKERLEQEGYKTQLALARQIQKSLMPHHFADTRELEFETLYIPHDEISGDYFDFFHIENSNVSIFCIADVAGKGIPAALLMANLQASLRRLSINFIDLETLIVGLNEAVYENTQGERLVTIFLAAYDVMKNELTYINAGHNYPIICDSKNGMRFLKKGTTPIGIQSRLPVIEIGREIIQKDTVILSYTDGLEELRNDKGEMVGTDKIISLMNSTSLEDIAAVVDKIERFIENYKQNEPIWDDITVLLCKIKPEGIIKQDAG